ncbi:hypothetical protein D5F01_LYC17856 [Larimichthys crocea]|uniref:DUF4585 domain-containing protein n=1 Tax=Larimichthys crocea TaxID=215358 RepID=A0A6G0HZN2_LARCR|nr:hypothetical protein D5F01_LYC17856 [Larimichthys crocea]
MTCVEKRHMSHRVGSMLHHRFPNGFTDLFMDETDREVSTLTDRAFRSLCVGDDAVYNDELLYGYSPFSCHKPLAGEPPKKSHKESKKQGQNKNDNNYAQPWKQQKQKSISHMSSFLKALSATEESCEGMLIKNGGMTDSKGESWDKSALRSIQRELSEFSSDYHTNLSDGHYKNHHRHHSGDRSSNKTGKDVGLPSGKSSKIKNGKSTVKLRKLNIKNFFLHSEFSPFQTWRDFNQFPFGQEDTVLPTDNIPKWYDLPFYKELTEAHRKETLHTEEVQSCQKAVVEPPPPIAPKPFPPPPPPKVLPKPSATPAEKRCSSDGGDGSAAPWRRNRSRARSVIPVNQPGVTPQENSLKTVDESLFMFKKEARSVEVKAIEEVSSLASTPFSICQLMTPLIPSRQPTETSEILQGVLSPSVLDLPLRPHSEAKLTPEPPVKRDSYKSLASSILFNLKDNRKRVKSRYSPPKFKTLEEEDRFSGVSPSSEGVESFTTSTADTADELGINVGVPVDCEVSKVPSEHSGSTCSANESQTGLPKPPAVLPKSEKAVLKAIKIANRRMKKEEAQKSPHKSSQSSSKQRVDKHKSDKSEHKSNSSSSRSGKSGEKKHREKIEDGHHHSESHGQNSNRSEQPLYERTGQSGENNHHNRTDAGRKTRRQSHDSMERNTQNNEGLASVTERQGRSSNRHVREKPEQRDYSSDRIISNVPVYKAHISERSTSDRPFHRSQSTDRYLGDKVERRLSADMSINEKLVPRTQRIEKSIMDELQQRGRAKDKASRDNPLRRSHSIDTYTTEAPHPSNLSRQSSHTSQLSRQSSIEHAIVTQSFPMTQRKLLQDPDSGQYFFVDMPVQVKTKTFFDPATGSYVQLPVQPPEGAVPQASPMEVLTPPMVVYHGFVPVPLSPMAQKATIQAPHIAPEEFEQRHLERSRQMQCKERHPYLEPVYGQHDHMLGEFMGTEELDCPS